MPRMPRVGSLAGIVGAIAAVLVLIVVLSAVHLLPQLRNPFAQTTLAGPARRASWKRSACVRARSNS